jgi:hypothetical protein
MDRAPQSDLNLLDHDALVALALPYFFERKDGMSEMNWPNGPDPFHYREHRNEIDYVGHMFPA